MANATATQIITDGYRNAVVKLTGVLDTSDVAVTDVIAVASYSPVPTQFRIDKIDYSVSSQLAVQLLWKATTDVVITTLTGSDHQKFHKIGGLQNNAGTGKNGTIRLKTTGWASGTQTYTITLWLVKQGV